jgi:hypothetical protein
MMMRKSLDKAKTPARWPGSFCLVLPHGVRVGVSVKGARKMADIAKEWRTPR